MSQKLRALLGALRAYADVGDREHWSPVHDPLHYALISTRYGVKRWVLVHPDAAHHLDKFEYTLHDTLGGQIRDGSDLNFTDELGANRVPAVIAHHPTLGEVVVKGGEHHVRLHGGLLPGAPSMRQEWDNAKDDYVNVPNVATPISQQLERADHHAQAQFGPNAEYVTRSAQVAGAPVVPLTVGRIGSKVDDANAVHNLGDFWRHPDQYASFQPMIYDADDVSRATGLGLAWASELPEEEEAWIDRLNARLMAHEDVTGAPDRHAGNYVDVPALMPSGRLVDVPHGIDYEFHAGPRGLLADSTKMPLELLNVAASGFGRNIDTRLGHLDVLNSLPHYPDLPDGTALPTLRAHWSAEHPDPAADMNLMRGRIQAHAEKGEEVRNPAHSRAYAARSTTMNRETLHALLETLRAYAVPEDFKGNPDYHVDKDRYKAIGAAGGRGRSHEQKHLTDGDVGGAFVHAHWNIHQGRFSVKPPHTNETLGHLDSLHLGGPDGVRFAINESGRKRVLETGQKNPHAFISGIVQRTAIDESHVPKEAFPIGYSPRHGHFFKVEKGEDGKMKPGAALDRAGEVFMLPPHPSVAQAYQKKLEEAKASGGNMADWRRQNKAPIGRVFATHHPKDGRDGERSFALDTSGTRISRDGKHKLVYTKGHVKRWTDLYSYDKASGEGSVAHPLTAHLLNAPEYHDLPGSFDAGHLGRSTQWYAPQGEGDASHDLTRNALARLEEHLGPQGQGGGRIHVPEAFLARAVDTGLSARWGNLGGHLEKHQAEAAQDCHALHAFIRELGDPALHRMAAANGINLKPETDELAYAQAGALMPLAAHVAREVGETPHLGLYRTDGQVALNIGIDAGTLKDFGGSGRPLLGGISVMRDTASKDALTLLHTPQITTVHNSAPKKASAALTLVAPPPPPEPEPEAKPLTEAVVK